MKIYFPKAQTVLGIVMERVMSFNKQTNMDHDSLYNKICRQQNKILTFLQRLLLRHYINKKIKINVLWNGSSLRMPQSDSVYTLISFFANIMAVDKNVETF